MMNEEKQNSGPVEVSARGPEDWVRWAALAVGLVMAAIGGVIKISEVLKDPTLFEYVFFSGSAYIIMICGLALVIVSISYSLFFDADPEGP